MFRISFLSIECRKSLLCGAFSLFQFFFNQNAKKDFGKAKVSVRSGKNTDGVTFFEPTYLLRVIHLVICIYQELKEGPGKLRMSAFGSHINENIIGRIRVGCHGNPRFPVIMRVVAKAEMRRILQSELGIQDSIRGRDNVGGTKLDPSRSDTVDGIDFEGLAKRLIKSLTSGSIDDLESAVSEIASFLEEISERENESYPVYLPNSSSNSGIMARLIHLEQNYRQLVKKYEFLVFHLDRKLFYS